MQLVLHCYTAVLYEPISKLYISNNSAVYLSDAKVTFFFFFFCFFFVFVFVLQGTGLRNPISSYQLYKAPLRSNKMN